MRKQRGLAIIVVMFALSILATTTLGITYLSNAGLVQSQAQGDRDIALYAAKAGLELKLAELKNDDFNDISGTMPGSTTEYVTDVFASGEQPWSGFTVPGTDTYYILSEGIVDPTAPNPRKRKVGMLVRKSSSGFNIAALATNKITMKEGTFTQTYSSDPLDPVTPSDHLLATIGVVDSAGEIVFDAGSGSEPRVGWDGTTGTANVYGGPGSDVSMVTGGAQGTNFNTFNVQSTLTPPAPVDPRPYGSTDVVADGTGVVTTVTPVQLPGPDSVLGTSDDIWEFQAHDIKAENGGKVVLDISAVPDDKVARFNFHFLKMENGGVVELQTGTSQATCEFYIESGVLLENGAILNPTTKPSRLQFLVNSGDVEIKSLTSVGYMVLNVPQNKVKLEAGELRGSVVANEVELLDGARIFYDKQLTTTNTGASNLIILSYQEF